MDHYYQATEWQPHCTVAYNVATSVLDRIAAAVPPVAEFGPVKVEVVYLRSYRPAKELLRAPLAGPARDA